MNLFAETPLYFAIGFSLFAIAVVAGIFATIGWVQRGRRYREPRVWYQCAACNRRISDRGEAWLARPPGSRLTLFYCRPCIACLPSDFDVFTPSESGSQ